MFVNSHHLNIEEGAQVHTLGREVVVRQPCMALQWHYSKAHQAAGQRAEQQPPSCQEPEQHQNHILSESKGGKNRQPLGAKSKEETICIQNKNQIPTS
jgi:hypothetical protein